MRRDIGGFPLFLINLDSRPDRLAQASQRLQAAGLEADRVSALNAEQARSLGHRVARAAVEHEYWLLTDGNVGCAATHLEIYRRIVSDGLSGGVIFEDDVIVVDDFLRRAERALSRRQPRSQLVQFGWLFEPIRLRSRAADRVHRWRRGDYRDRLASSPFRDGTHCYWVGREFAAAALEMLDPIFSPIDAMLRSVTHYASWECEVHWPSLAGQDGSASDIRPGSPASRSATPI